MQCPFWPAFRRPPLPNHSAGWYWTRNKRYARASSVVLCRQIGSSEYIPRGRIAAHVEDIVEPWSERKGRVGLAWWSAAPTALAERAACLPITARVYLPLTFELRFVCALGVQPASQSVSQLASHQPEPLSMPTGLGLILDAAWATTKICKFAPARIWELPVEPSILFAVRAICVMAWVLLGFAAHSVLLFEVVCSVPVLQIVLITAS